MIARGLYVHWPFCVSKCPYCDFNSHVREEVEQARWRDALTAELRHWRERTDSGPLSSVFFGGGTPSLMPPETVEAVLTEAEALFGFEPGIEITLEANPSSAEAGRFKDFRAAGINRLSLGVQSFDDAALTFLGRAHDSEAALAAIEMARRTFPRFSFDLIYALPGQTEADWQTMLSRALVLSDGHLSLYQLTIEPNTGFAGAVKRGVFTPMADDPAADLYELTGEMCRAAGLPAYETSNYAAPGQESRHNLIYWRYGAWIGVGPGAHGRPLVTGQRRATANLKKPEAWLSAIENQGHALEEDRALNRGEQAEEALMMGLRLSEGIDAARFEQATGVALSDVLEARQVEELSALGLVAQEPDNLRVTAEGALLLNTISARLLSGGNDR